jgi:hypothetical protein
MLSGPVPATNSTVLLSIAFNQNQFSGPLPSVEEEFCFRKCGSVQALKLSGNLLNGSIPDWIFRLNYIGYVALASNQFTGLVPAGVFEAASGGMSVLLSQNKLTGFAPVSLAQPSRLAYLTLSDNEFEGLSDLWSSNPQHRSELDCAL